VQGGVADAAFPADLSAEREVGPVAGDDVEVPPDQSDSLGLVVPHHAERPDRFLF
jgi:hypothetical protein